MKLLDTNTDSNISKTKTKNSVTKNKENSNSINDTDLSNLNESKSPSLNSEEYSLYNKIINSNKKNNNKELIYAAKQEIDISDLIANQKQESSINFINLATNKTNTKSYVTGDVEVHNINPHFFNEQMYSYRTYGIANDPSAINSDNTGVIFKSNNHSNLDKSTFIGKSRTQKDYAKTLKESREKFGDPSKGDFKGPWASYKGEELFSVSGQLNEDQKEMLNNIEEERLKKKKETSELAEKKNNNFEATTLFHLQDEKDYLGRSFIDPPSHLKQNDHVCFIPKKLVHTYVGHTDGVNKIQYFPNLGHLMLSCSQDSRVKLWDVMTNRKCVRTYIGHTEAVKDISFSYNGRNFISVGYDKIIRYWDTETGQVLMTFNNKKIPFCCAMNPDPNNGDSFLVGTHIKSILQYDIRSAQVTMTYDEHIGAINTLTFIDNKRFVSTSDDKKLFLWEFGVPVVVKHISEPTMHSIPAACLYPNGEHFVGQCLDNKISVYDCKNGFRNNRKKKFTGHSSAGYTCGIDVSPDGQFLVSGDTTGALWFWDWKTCKNYRVLTAHNKVVSDVKWHPIQSSKVASCSWDNTIKLWD